MKTIYTDYIKKKYKGKYYYIRAWLSYELAETSTQKSITFTAGFQTKTRKCSMKAITMQVSDGTHKKSASKKWNGMSATASIKYIDTTTWTWDKTTDNQNITVNLLGTFGSTRFSGMKVQKTLGVVIPALGRPEVSFVAERDSNTQTTLTINVLADAPVTVTEPTVYRNGEAITPTWKVEGETITFPYSTASAQIVAADTVDEMHSFEYSFSGTVGSYEYEDGSSVDYVYYPEWKQTVSINEKVPDLNFRGKADINVYAYDYDLGTMTLLPNDEGWDIEIIDDTHWNLPVYLKEQYVSDKTSHTASAQIDVEYKTYTSAQIDDKIAIFNTTRNANFSTGLANNVFIGGCTLPDYSSRVWYSYVNNPLYMPDTNYIEVGSNDTRVMGLVKVGDYLGIIKQSKSIDSSVFLVYPTSFEDETTFATKACVSGVGALSQYCFNVLGDETLFLSPRGVMAIEPSEDEQSRIKDRSYFVNGRLLEEIDLDKAYSFVWNGLYLLAVNNHVYVLDGSQRNSWGNQKTNLVYECYFLDNVPAKILFSYDSMLWFADFEGNLCRFKNENDDDPYMDEETPVKAEWSTIADDDGSLHYYKNLQKKGVVLSLLPEEGTTAKVYVKKDENDEVLVTESSPVAPNTKLPSSVYMKKKVKKYKMLQFIVEDDTPNPFGINKIIKSYTIGNYAKK